MRRVPTSDTEFYPGVVDNAAVKAIGMEFGGETASSALSTACMQRRLRSSARERASVTPGLRRWSDRIPTEAPGRRADIT